MTVPALFPVIVTVQVPLERVQLLTETNLTEPAPPFTWDQVTTPVGEYPVTLAVHLTTFEEPATT
jgi:hypothetical protein